MSKIPQIPRSYQLCQSNVYNPEDTITGEETFDLYVAGGWYKDACKPPLVAGLSYLLETNSGAVGVRDRGGTLVGVGLIKKNLIGDGFLSEPVRGARFSGLMVHPAHRGKQLGEAIVRNRLKLVDEAHLPSFVADLAPTNTIRHKYLQLGFSAINSGFFRPAQK